MSIARDQLIDQRQIWPTEQIRIELSPFRGQTYIGVRKWYASGADYLPGKGLNVHVRHLPWLLKALRAAETAALEAGALDEECYELVGLPLPRELGGAA